MLTTQLQGGGRRLRAAVVAAIALAGATAAIAAGTAPASATATHQAKPHHQSHRSTRHMLIKGLVASHHKRTITVFARTAKLGTKTTHNERFHVTFARSVHGRVRVPMGDHITIEARGRIDGHRLLVVHNSGETVTPSPASLLFGTVEFIDGNLVTVAQSERDNGDGGNEGPGHHHAVTIDDTNAAISVDGSSGTLAVGDTVAVLGEVTSDTFVASTVYAFTTTPSFERGQVRGVVGSVVTLRNDGNSDTVDLTGVSLVINGDGGALASQLTPGDKLVVIGQFNATDNTFTPDLAFAFNGHDNEPCGHNEHGDDNGGGGHGGGSDGGSDG